MEDLRYIHIPLELWGAFFCIVAVICVLADKEKEKASRSMLGGLLATNTVLLIADTFAWFFRGNPTLAGYVIVRVSNFVVFISNYVMIIFFTMYFYYILPKEKRPATQKYVCIIYIISITAVVGLVISQFTNWFYYFDENNLYHRNERFYWITILFGLLGLLVFFILLLQNRRSLNRYTYIAIMLYTMMPVIASVIQLLIYGISILNIGITMTCLLVFMTFEIEQAKEKVRMERKLSNMQVEILLSQIKPHFLFNVLTSIKYLCKEDSKEAEQAVDDLARYLRENVDTVNRKMMISVEQEISHVRNYILLEQRRFENRVLVEYDVREVDFMIPSFTLQPLVENAIKHGITKRAEGGTVKLYTGFADDSYYVCVEDDGVGFDVNAMAQGETGHVGIENVKLRLKNLCNGRLELYSVPGKGSKAVIFIPAGMHAVLGED